MKASALIFLGRGLRRLVLTVLCAAALASSAPATAAGVSKQGAIATAPVPALSSLLKPNVYKRMIEDREVMVHAELAELADLPQKPTQKYSFYATMLVRASEALTREVLTDYALYAKMIPYIDRADYDAKTQTLLVEGGLWKFRLLSRVKFEERGSKNIHYRIIGGHFTGLSGDIYFESQGEKGTAVLFNGALSGAQWPPRFIIERGAEIVFGFTGNRMRSYIEAKKKETGPGGFSGDSKQRQIPQPRSHL